MGEKCFSALFSLMGEEIKSKPLIDRLNRIEELGILDKNEWLALRKNRNEVVAGLNRLNCFDRHAGWMIRVFQEAQKHLGCHIWTTQINIIVV